MTRVLFDALTPKQARIAAVLHIEGAGRGVEVVITCRDYMHVADMLELYGVPYRCVGKYGVSLYEKLVYGLERQRALAEVAMEVDAMVSFPSPDAARVVFGLGKPLVVLNDTPHAHHVNRLVIPLSDVLVAPAATPEEAWRGYCPRRVVTFDGVFEYMWTSRFAPNPDVVRKLGLSPGGYVVFRPEEAHAAYYRWDYAELRRRLVEEARRLGYVVVNIPRYPDQIMDGVVNLTKAVDHLQLAYFSAGVVTGGASMATEAALLGVPALSYFPESYYLDDYLAKRGAPLYRCRDLETCRGALREMFRVGRAGPLKLEDPSRVIFEVVSGVVSR
jgi:predicted glycosyltransferase